MAEITIKKVSGLSNQSRPLASRGTGTIAYHNSGIFNLSNQSRPLASRGRRLLRVRYRLSCLSNQSRPLASRGRIQAHNRRQSIYSFQSIASPSE